MANSHEVALSTTRPGDLIIIRGAGAQSDRDHVLLIVETISEPKLKTIAYIHSWQTVTDGKYNHGTSTGTIEILEATKNLLDQRWREQGKSNEENELWQYAKGAQTLAIRRLNCLK